MRKYSCYADLVTEKRKCQIGSVKKSEVCSKHLRKNKNDTVYMAVSKQLIQAAVFSKILFTDYLDRRPGQNVLY